MKPKGTKGHQLAAGPVLFGLCTSGSSGHWRRSAAYNRGSTRFMSMDSGGCALCQESDQSCDRALRSKSWCKYTAQSDESGAAAGNAYNTAAHWCTLTFICRDDCIDARSSSFKRCTWPQRIRMNKNRIRTEYGVRSVVSSTSFCDALSLLSARRSLEIKSPITTAPVTRSKALTRDSGILVSK